MVFQESFNIEFCNVLEKFFTQLFSRSEDKKIRCMWCDGVLMPYVENQLIKKSVNDSRKIETTTWIGIGSRNQVEFELIIHFGKYALRRYAKGKSLEDCLPSLENVQSDLLDVNKSRIELHLL